MAKCIKLWPLNNVSIAKTSTPTNKQMSLSVSYIWACKLCHDIGLDSIDWFNALISQVYVAFCVWVNMDSHLKYITYADSRQRWIIFVKTTFCSWGKWFKQNADLQTAQFLFLIHDKEMKRVCKYVNTLILQLIQMFLNCNVFELQKHFTQANIFKECHDQSCILTNGNASYTMT